jgi:hypothetical protein
LHFDYGYHRQHGGTQPPIADASVSATKNSANCDTDLPSSVPANTIRASVGIGEGNPSSSIATARRIAKKLYLANVLTTLFSLVTSPLS